MATPILTWAESDDTELSSWETGRLNAGETAEEKIIHIWNNKGGTETVPDMKDVQFTTVSDDANCDAVINKWINIRCLSTPEGEEENTDFYPVGGDETHTITAEGCEAGIIKGTKNDGTNENVKNYASIACTCKVPAAATSGTRKLFGRVIYYYV